MSVQSESVLELLGKLCDLHLGQTKRCHLVQPKAERDVHFQRLRRKAFDTLFGYLKSPESKQSNVGAGGVRVEVDSVLRTVYDLRVARRFQDADRLEQLLEHYLANRSEDRSCVLRLLTSLAGTGSQVPSSPLGHATYKTPIISETTEKDVHLPGGPLCYGDYQETVALGAVPLSPYMHYPPQLFRAAACYADGHSYVMPLTVKPVNIFTMLPGTGFGSSSLFSTEKETMDSHGRLTRMTLFGGLTHVRDTSMAVKLDLPDLPDDPQTCPPEITIPKAVSMSELSEDEGFITTEGSSSVTTPGESFVEEDIWDLALTTSPCHNYVWERIGCEPMVTERPYLTEAGPQALDELCHQRRHHEHLLQASTSTHSCSSAAGAAAESLLPPRQLSPAQLIRDITYLLIGIPSRTFLYIKEKEKFMVDPTVSTSGLSPEALQSLTKGFVTCGTHYQRLTEFSASSSASSCVELASTYTQGLVLQAFKGGIRAALQHYRAAVLSLPSSLSLLALNMHSVKAIRQIQFLAELCHCTDSTTGQTFDAAFPLGVALISYLYQEAVSAINTDNYLLMLSLLRNTCQPFVMFVQDWVFHGTFRDVYGEFMIQMNHKFLEARDETYWEQGYTLTTQDEAASVPTFLAHLAADIFRCGKALNLLRMCCPNHFLCSVSDSEIPQLSISYARSDLRDINTRCEIYVSRLQQVARQLSTSRVQQQQRAEEAQRELLETAHHMAATEIARLQGILDAHKQKKDVEKRKEFQRLKEQMTTDLQRRAEEVAEARKEDQEYMARLTRRQDAMTQRDIELEKQARDELIAYYTELGEEAARRERRALWRIRRAQLETRRESMLEADAERWKTEMDEHMHAQGLLNKASETDSLPDWAQKSQENDITETLQVGGPSHWDNAIMDSSKGTRDWSLPKWADHLEPFLPSSDHQDVATSQFIREQNAHHVQVGREVEEEVEVSVVNPNSSVGSKESSTTVKSESSTMLKSESYTTAKSESSAVAKSESFTTVKSESSHGLNIESVSLRAVTCASSMVGNSEQAASRTVEHESSTLTAARTEWTSPESAPTILDQCREDRMPAWARQVLQQGTDSISDTDLITDSGNDKDKTVSHLAFSHCVGSDFQVKGSSVDQASRGEIDSGVSSCVIGSRGGGVSPGSDVSGGSDFSVSGGGVNGGGSGGGGISIAVSGGGDDHGDMVSDTQRTPRGKTSIHMVEGMSVHQQTEEQPAKAHIQISDKVQATTESSGLEEAPFHIRFVPGMSATTETQSEESMKTNITMSKTMHATKETDEQEQRLHLRMVAEHNANFESCEEVHSIPRLGGSSKYNLSTETSSREWQVKKASLFGHVSQLSKQEYSFQVPRLKRHRDLYANLESELREFAVRPGIRMHKQRMATTESEEHAHRPVIRSFKDRHANLESEFVDVEGLRRKRFLEHNIFGHASDSTVQRLLYGAGFGSRAGQEETEVPELQELVPRFDLAALDLMPDLMEKLDDSFDRLNGSPSVDLLASLPGVVHGSVGAALWQGELTEEEADLITLTPLPVLLQQALIAPLSAQISLVDQMVVNYFLIDLKMESHFEALHRYLFMADGDFAQNLTDILLEKLSTVRLPQEMLTPVFLNTALNRALQLSVSVSQQHADCLSFSMRYMPDIFKHNAHDTLDCLELRYKVDWPLNVVLTESSQVYYGQVFSFMLQLKRVAWSLNQCWYKLKRDAIVKKAKDSCQFRQLQLHRQEQQHFVKVMQGYMASQIIQVTWRELQQSLDTDVHSLDDLRRVHNNYLHKAIFRCLLNKKAAPIMKIIQDIFCLILKFCALLNSATWEQDSATGEITHPNFATMVASYKAFKEYFVFLFKVVNKLAVRGYQPHLHELLLRLNFNDYYTSK